MSIATLTAKGQITLPKDIRMKLHLETGEKIDFRIDEKSGTVTLAPINKTVDQVFGMLSEFCPKKQASVEDMDAGIANTLKKEHSESN
jgi:antitoxin PrlF